MGSNTISKERLLEMGFDEIKGHFSHKSLNEINEDLFFMSHIEGDNLCLQLMKYETVGGYYDPEPISCKFNKIDQLQNILKSLTGI